MPDQAKFKQVKQAVAMQAASVMEADEVRLLTEIGFLAAGNGLSKPAMQIFAALKLIRPDHAFPVIGQAVTLLNRGLNIQAVKVLEKTQLASDAEQQEIDTWLGFALQQSGHYTRANRVLESAIYNNPKLSNTDSAKLALALLEINVSVAPVPHNINAPGKQSKDQK